VGWQRRSQGSCSGPAGGGLNYAAGASVWRRRAAALVLLALALTARAADPPPPDEGLLEFLGRGDDEKTALKDWAGDGTAAPQDPGGQADAKPVSPVKAPVSAGGADKPS
jgi:hypothetical protein